MAHVLLFIVIIFSVNGSCTIVYCYYILAKWHMYYCVLLLFMLTIANKYLSALIAISFVNLCVRCLTGDVCIPPPWSCSCYVFPHHGVVRVIYSPTMELFV